MAEGDSRALRREGAGNGRPDPPATAGDEGCAVLKLASCGHRFTSVHVSRNSISRHGSKATPCLVSDSGSCASGKSALEGELPDRPTFNRDADAALLSVSLAPDNRYQRSGDGERFVQRRVEMAAVIRVPDAHMAPDRGHLAADPVRDEARLVMTVDRRKIPVRLAGQNDGLRLYAAERLSEVAVVSGCIADVAVHPSPEQRQ